MQADLGWEIAATGRTERQIGRGQWGRLLRKIRSDNAAGSDRDGTLQSGIGKELEMVDCMQYLMLGSACCVIVIIYIPRMVAMAVIVQGCPDLDFADMVKLMCEPGAAVAPRAEVRQKKDEHQKRSAADKGLWHRRNFTMRAECAPLQVPASCRCRDISCNC
jgi:hypothetical protein